MTKEVNASSWATDVENSEKPVAVDFWQDGCVWCQRLAPVFDEVAGEYDRAVLASVDIRAEPANTELAGKFGIMGTPTTKVFCGGRVVGEIVGFRDKNALKEELDRIIDGSDDCVAQSSKIG